MSAALPMLVCGWPAPFFFTENLPSSALTLTMCPHLVRAKIRARVMS